MMKNRIKLLLKKIPFLVKLKKLLFPQRYAVQNFLTGYFGQNISKKIIQVGANDGIMSDPLRPFFERPGNYQAILVEPIPFYINKLRDLYKDRGDMKIVHAALGAESKVEKLFFIPPQIADLMNGDGPPNNWAHGQGSFDRNTVIGWIEKNKFRGKDYCQKVPEFISSITHIETHVRQIKEFISSADTNLLLVIDVQGFELEVLMGVDWNNPPRYIIFEDDLNNTTKVVSYLKSKGYIYVGGKTDKIFSYGSVPKF